jgi:small subunit ribosomal protein S9
MKKEPFSGIGRRKNSTARVYLSSGSGNFVVNSKFDLNSYLKRESLVIHAAGAIQLGVARALLESDDKLRSQLKTHGLLTRDAREVERKKYGQPGARKKFQFSKR